MAERMPWFPCYQSKLLGALAGMPPDSGYLYTIVILRSYEVEGVCPDSVDVLARRTGMTKGRVQKAIEWLLDQGKLIQSDGGLANPFAIEVLSERIQKHFRLSSAGKLGAEIKSKKTKEKQCGRSSQAKAKGNQPSSILDIDIDIDIDIDKDLKKIPPLPPKAKPAVDDWPEGYLDLFWNRYPPGRKQDRVRVGKKLDQLRASKTVTWTTIMDGVERFIASRPDPQFTAAPLVWLNNARWENEYISGGTNAANRNGGSKVGFSGLAAKLRQEIRDEELFDRRCAPEDLRPVNGR